MINRHSYYDVDDSNRDGNSDRENSRSAIFDLKNSQAIDYCEGDPKK